MNNEKAVITHGKYFLIAAVGRIIIRTSIHQKEMMIHRDYSYHKDALIVL